MIAGHFDKKQLILPKCGKTKASTIITQDDRGSFRSSFYAVRGSVQVLAVGGNDLFVPVEAVLGDTVVGAAAIVIGIYVDETVALGHLLCGFADEVKAGPAGITEQFNSIFGHRIPHGFDMFTVVINAVRIVYFAINQLIFCTDSVFHYKQWLVVAVIKIDQ